MLNLELSKQLCNKGVRLETEKAWNRWKHNYGDSREYMPGDEHIFKFGNRVENTKDFEVIPCPSTDDLLAVLPQIITLKKIKYQLFISLAMDRQWFIVYANEKDYNDNYPFKIMMCHSLSEALSKMIIYLSDHEGYKFNQEKGRLER